MPLTPSTTCPKCGAKGVNITCLDDPREQFICIGCGATFEGDSIDPAEQATAQAEFNELIERMRAADRGE